MINRPNTNAQRLKRHKRVRGKISGTPERPRLNVFRSNANIYAQISLALNRVYTEWYPSKGYNFNITNSTQYDQYYVSGRNIFTNISRIVDDIFNTYLRRVGDFAPYYAEYCNGTTVTCKGMSQWGTVSLAESGLSPIQILRRYYGNNFELVTTNAPFPARIPARRCVWAVRATT